MTIPINLNLPAISDEAVSTPSGMVQYLKDLTYDIEKMYDEVSDGVNGNLSTNDSVGQSAFTPTILDSADEDTTFTYDHQIGWVLRKGLFVDIWFDVKWSAVLTGTVNGTMEIELPYKVAKTEQKPFVGVLQSSVFAYTAGTECVINARSNTFILDVWNVGDGFTTANQGSVSAGHLIGNIRYVGQGIERKET